MKQQIDLRNAPQDWLEQGEDVDEYAPSEAYDPDDEEYSQPEWFEPPPDIAPTDMESPSTEQGFLMPDEMAQNFAPENSQLGESVMADTMEQPNADDGQY